MKMIYLIRHGQKENYKSDPGLTKLGLHQAQKTAQLFSKMKLGKIVASPSLRTKLTAREIAKYHQLPIIEDSLLIERLDLIDQPKMTFKEFITIWRKTSDNRDWIPPFGSSSYKSAQRMQDALAKYLPGNFSGDLVIVTHGGIITDFLRNLVGDDYLIKNYFGSYERLRDTYTQECSITSIQKDRKGWKLLDLFKAEHLINVI